MKAKIILPFIAILAMFIMTACEDILDVKFSYTMADMTFEYGPDTITGDLTFMQDSVVNKLDSIALANGSNISKLQSAKLKTCNISISDPSDSNFNMVNQFEAYISTSTQPEIKLASLTPVPKDTNSVNLTVYDQEIVNYLKAPAFNFSIKGNKTKALGKKYVVKVRLTFDAVATGI